MWLQISNQSALLQHRIVLLKLVYVIGFQILLELMAASVLTEKVKELDPYWYLIEYAFMSNVIMAFVPRANVIKPSYTTLGTRIFWHECLQTKVAQLFSNPESGTETIIICLSWWRLRRAFNDGTCLGSRGKSVACYHSNYALSLCAYLWSQWLTRTQSLGVLCWRRLASRWPQDSSHKRGSTELRGDADTCSWLATNETGLKRLWRVNQFRGLQVSNICDAKPAPSVL